MSSAVAPPRLPRYRRAAGEVPLLLTERDLNILARVESHRLASSDQLRHLVQGSGQQILRRLQKLYHAGYLDRIRPQPVKGGGSTPMVYAIANRGVRALLEAGRLQDASQTDWSAKNRSLHDLSVAHALLVSQVRTVVELASAARPNFRLPLWREGRDLYDAAEVVLAEGYRRIPVAPDAYFALENAKGRMHFFLEADRGTMTLKRFVLKLKAYAAFFRERRHQEKFSIRFFRVLTVTTSAVRKRNLVSAARAEDDVRALGRMFLFTDETALSVAHPERVLGSIWTTAQGEDASLVLGSSGVPNDPERRG